MLDVFLGFSNSYMIKMPLYHTFNTFLFISLFINFLPNFTLSIFYSSSSFTLPISNSLSFTLPLSNTLQKKKKKREMKKSSMFNEGLSNYFAFILLNSYLLLNIFQYEVNLILFVLCFFFIYLKI